MTRIPQVEGVILGPVSHYEYPAREKGGINPRTNCASPSNCEITNTVRERVWRQQPRGFLTEAFIDTDGTVAPTFGKCKGGMALSYKGIWGYAPLAVSLANTNEVLYLVNRPGNGSSRISVGKFL